MYSTEHTALIDDISDEDDLMESRSSSPRNLPSNSNNYDQKELNNYEEALKRIGFGKFHYLILFVCGLANASDAIEILCVSFILPTAECDLKLTTSDKGFLNAITFLGMMFGGYIWGTLSDLLGRKYILASALLFNAFFAILAGLSQTFGWLLFFRLMSGLGVGGSIPIVWSYFTEFMPKDIRGRMMCCLATSWVVGNLLVVFLGFVILKRTDINFHFITESIVVNNWRFFMICCAFPSIISAILLLFLPESPKFYLYNHKHSEVQKVLQYVYLFNNKVNSTHSIDAKLRAFKFFEKLNHRPIISSQDYIRDRFIANRPQNLKEICINNILNILKQTSLLFKPPHTLNTILLLFIMFALCFGYYGLWMWLPELFKRMSIYGGGPCTKYHNVTLDESILKTCNIDNSVFVSSLISALSNIPGNVFTILFIDRFGRNIITISTLIISGISVFGISVITSQTQGVILTTIFGGITVLTFNSFGCTCTELYPTTLRSTALGVQYVAGRLGAILGNLLFGLAVDTSCYIPLFAISSVLILSGLLAIKLPESSKIDIH